MTLRLRTVFAPVVAVLLFAFAAHAQQTAPAAAPAAPGTATQAASQLPPDPWPRVLDLSNGQVLVYQPQVNKWDGNRLDFRAAMAIKVTGAKDESFGVIFATVRTQVDKVARTVVFEDYNVTKVDFPTLPNRGAAYSAELTKEFAAKVRTMSLDRLQASLAAQGIRPPTVEVQNNPPQVIVSYSPALLVPIDGAPVLKPVPSDSRFQRVINTRALILRGGLGQRYFVHVFDGWLMSESLSGPWEKPFLPPAGADAIAQSLSKSGVVDLLDGGPNANPKPSLANGIPTIYTSQVPTELIVFKGQPDFVPIVGTQLLWASNTSADVLINTANNNYYVLLAGRWFTGGSLNGPWTFVASDALPPDFAKIPPQSSAGAVLPTVAGTPQAQEAVIENSIPQTATVPLKNGPTFTPQFDGPPQFAPVAGTSLSYVTNSHSPIIQVSPNQFYSVTAGVWFTSNALTGPWRIATSVPPVIYTIPPSSPIYYVTYVRIYEATPQVVYVGYTPGYLGTVVAPYGTIVYGTGYAYSPWIGNVWYAPPYTYGIAAAPVYNPYVGYTYGFAMGLATAAWMYPWWGGGYYYPSYWGGYGCCATASANVYGHWGNTTWSGTRSWYAGGGVAGTTASGNYYNSRTGTSGSYNAGRQYNAWTGNATRGYDRTMNGAAGGSGQVARASNYNTYTGQRSTANAASGTGAGGSSYNRAGATTAGPEGNAHVGGGSTYNAKTGQTNTWATASVGNNHYADVNGNVYKNTGDGWQEHSSGGGWNNMLQNTSSADREAQSRSDGEGKWGSFSEASPMSRRNSGGGDRFGGGGFGGFGGGDRFGGGFGGGDRFAGGGFGGGFGGRFGGGGFGGFHGGRR
jgi:hypothetical protein